MECPRCGSYKVKTKGKAFWFFAPILAASIFFWIGLFFTPLLILAGIFLLLCPFGLLMPKSHSCEDCNYVWLPSKKDKVKSPS